MQVYVQQSKTLIKHTFAASVETGTPQNKHAIKSTIRGSPLVENKNLAYKTLPLVLRNVTSALTSSQ